MNKLSYLFCFLFFCLSFSLNGQIYYERPIEGVTQDWHKLILPDDAFKKMTPDFSGMRVYAQDESGARIEQPYLLKINQPYFESEQVAFEIINRTSRDNARFYTLKLAKGATINHLDLDFDITNYDWKLDLEGSMDQKEWFNILTDYRILAIKNKSTDYQFGKLFFDQVNYKYLRIKIKTKDEHQLEKASVYNRKEVRGTTRNWKPKLVQHLNNDKLKRSELRVELEDKFSVTELELEVDADYDYFRYCGLEYLADSTKTEKGWIENWRYLHHSHIISSYEKNKFTFSPVLTNKFRIRIQNNDDRMLKIPNVKVAGYTHELQIRFDGKPPYLFSYGNSKLKKARYDLVQFKDKIPRDLIAVQLGEERIGEGATSDVVEPLFKNKMWLWGIMALVILVLGGFTLQMMKE